MTGVRDKPLDVDLAFSLLPLSSPLPYFPSHSFSVILSSGFILPTRATPVPPPLDTVVIMVIVIDGPEPLSSDPTTESMGRGEQKVIGFLGASEGMSAHQSLHPTPLEEPVGTQKSF